MGLQRAYPAVLTKVATRHQASNGWDDPVKGAGSMSLIEISLNDGLTGGSGEFPEIVSSLSEFFIAQIETAYRCWGTVPRNLQEFLRLSFF
jgi:hypothetical protein